MASALAANALPMMAVKVHRFIVLLPSQVVESVVGSSNSLEHPIVKVIPYNALDRGVVNTLDNFLELLSPG